MSYKISVIMPIYNAENQLEHTINSVIKQSIGFNNIELILVDDCSTDNSKEIIKKYCKKYDNVIPYFSKKNHGAPGFGRNTGLKLATCKYLMFIDNDDEYDIDICKKLYDTLISENADIVGCNKISVDNISNIKQYISYKNGIIKGDKVIIEKDNQLFFESVAVWNKIYKKEIIDKNGLKFLEDTRADDFAFTMEYYMNSEKLVFLKDYHGYYWNMRSESLSHVVTKKHIDELLIAYSHIYYRLKQKNKQHLMNELIKGHVSYLILHCSYFDFKNDETILALKEIHDFENKIGFNLDLDTKWENIVNKFIQNENYTLAIFFLKSLQRVRNITFLRKINRTIN